MLLPGVVILLIFSYGPMVGMVMAFQKFNPVLGFFRSPWVGFDNFVYVSLLPDTLQVLWNTVFIAFWKIVIGFGFPIVVALFMNELQNMAFKRTVQTIVYLPHFLSWVILGGIMIDILSPSTGIVNTAMKAVGMKPVFFLALPDVFPWTLIVSDVWKEFGFTTVIYLAALTGIDPALYEAAKIDGAGRWRCMLNVTLPSILPTIVLMGVLSLGNVLNAGFEQVFNLYSPVVYSSGDILDTFVYRLGLLDAQYGVAAVVGLFKSAVSFVFIVVSYRLAYKLANYSIF
jgi:putative aldouronate transport system permease protein